MGAIVTIVLVACLLLIVTRRGRGWGAPELFAGLFGAPSDLGWPRGVQEEDHVVRWGVPPRRWKTEDATQAEDETPTIEDL